MVAGLDSPLKDWNGGGGWKLAVSTGQLSIIEIQKVASPADSVPEEQSSTRCKLQGILTWLAMTENLIGHKTRGAIEAGYNSDTTIKGVRTWLNTKYATR